MLPLRSLKYSILYALNPDIIQNGREVEMVTHRRVARPNSQESIHGIRKSEGVGFKAVQMWKQGSPPRKIVFGTIV